MKYIILTLLIYVFPHSGLCDDCVNDNRSMNLEMECGRLIAGVTGDDYATIAHGEVFKGLVGRPLSDLMLLFLIAPKNAESVIMSIDHQSHCIYIDYKYTETMDPYSFTGYRLEVLYNQENIILDMRGGVFHGS